MSEDDKETHNHRDMPTPPYGTFQGVANHPPPTAMGFPQPVPPTGFPGAPPPSEYYVHSYQTVPVYAVAEGRPLRVRRRRPCCCGMGFGWFLFIIGFFLPAIPWYVGALILLFSRIEPREKPGYVASTIAAVLSLVAIAFGLTRIDW